MFRWCEVALGERSRVTLAVVSGRGTMLESSGEVAACRGPVGDVEEGNEPLKDDDLGTSMVMKGNAAAGDRRRRGGLRCGFARRRLVGRMRIIAK